MQRNIINLMFIGPCIILIVVKREKLDATCFIITLFSAQHVYSTIEYNKLIIKQEFVR